MDRLLELLASKDPAELRLHGLAVDADGRLVSVHEARAAANRALHEQGLLQWQWPYRARWAKRIEAMGLEVPRRMARGTVAPPTFIASDEYESIELVHE